MAEKEERHNKTQKKDRIYVFTDKFVCENCKDWYEHIDPLYVPDCTECAPLEFPYLTRQEAIDKMREAAGKVYRGYFYSEPNHPNISDMMEAALNALLGVEK